MNYTAFICIKFYGTHGSFLPYHPSRLQPLPLCFSLTKLPLLHFSLTKLLSLPSLKIRAILRTFLYRDDKMAPQAIQTFSYQTHNNSYKYITNSKPPRPYHSQHTNKF